MTQLSIFKKADVCCWTRLLATHGYRGDIREAFESTYAFVLRAVWTESCDSYYSPQTGVRCLLSFRLPTLCYDENERAASDLFDKLQNGEQLPWRSDLADCMIRCCQDLRLDYPESDPLKTSIFVEWKRKN